MKRLTAILLSCLLTLSLAVAASAYFEAEEAFGEVAFSIGKQTVAWNADGTITDGEYYKVDLKPEWLSYAINDTDTDAGLAYAKATNPELYMSWDETYVYTATKYEVTEGHENLWDGDPASMWYSGAVQFNYANFDEVASEYRLEYGVGLSSDTGDTLYTVWADGVGNGYTPSQDDAKVWLDGNTLTYETRVPWEAFADEDNTGYKEGNGFNTTFVWSIGKGQDYVHIQLAEGCTGNGKHAENMAQVTLAAAPADGASAAPKGDAASETCTVGKNGVYDDIQLPGTNTAPAIDGKLDDCYVKIHDFYSPDENMWYDSEDALHEAKGEAWGTWDKDNFYGFFKVAEEDYFPQNGEADPPGSNYSSMYLALLATVPVNDLPENDLYIMQCSFNRSIEDTKEWKYTGSVVEQYRDNSGAYAIYDSCPFDFEVVNDGTYTYYEVKMPWDQIDRTGEVDFSVGHEWFFDYIITFTTDAGHAIVQYGQGLMNDIYDIGGIVTLVAAPGAAEPEPEPEPTYTYPASGAGDNVINGTVIGNETGWGDNAAAGAAAAFDGNPATFFDPLGVGDGFCGIDAGESYILDKVAILSRDGWADRFAGAMIQGSNDGENWTTLWTSPAAAASTTEYTIVTEFENNTGYSQYRYFNETNHGDVAEVEFYGAPGQVEPEPALPDIENYALGAKVSVTSTETDDFPGELAVDGDLATRWASAYTDDEAITIDLGKAKAVNYVALYWETAMASDYEIYGSLDENDLRAKTLATVTGNTENNNVVEFDTEAVRYITIHSSKRATEWGNSLYEIVVSGEGDAAVDEKLDAKAEAPNTFDFGVIAAVAAVISLGGFAVSKKRH